MGQILDLSISNEAREVAEKLTAKMPDKFPSMKAAVGFLADIGASVVEGTPFNAVDDDWAAAIDDWMGDGSVEPDGRAINDEIAGPEARSEAKGADFQVRPHAQDTDFDVESNKKIPQSWMAKRGE